VGFAFFFTIACGSVESAAASIRLADEDDEVDGDAFVPVSIRLADDEVDGDALVPAILVEDDDRDNCDGVLLKTTSDFPD